MPSYFAVIVRRGGRWWRASGSLTREAAVRASLRPARCGGERSGPTWPRATAPLHLGARTIRLDPPQVMGILNVTPDSFSDGGQFMDDPAAPRRRRRAMHEGGRGADRCRRRKHPSRRGGGVGRRRDQARHPRDRAAGGDGRGGQHRYPAARR